MSINKKQNYLSLVKSASNALENGQIDYSDWATAVIGEEMYSQETLRRCYMFFRRFLECLNKEEIDGIEDSDVIEEIKQAQEELIKERKKLQTVNTEAQQYYRERARSELLNEKIEESIRALAPIQVKYIPHKLHATKRTGLIAVSDLHAGSTFEVMGLFNEVVNSYDFDTMKTRMEKLIGLIDADAIECDDIVIAICGDLFENAIRTSSLMKLKEPVVDTVIKTSEFLCQWIAEVANVLEVPIKVVTIGGNHDQLSILGMKPRPEEENLTKIVVKFMELRFENVKQVTIEPYAETTVVNIQGVNVMFDHGTDSNLANTVNYFSNIYNIDVDEIIAGHLHQPESKAIGIADIGDKMIYRVGSIVGVDPFARKIRKASRPSAYFALYDNNNGHSWSRNYYL